MKTLKLILGVLLVLLLVLVASTEGYILFRSIYPNKEQSVVRSQDGKVFVEVNDFVVVHDGDDDGYTNATREMVLHSCPFKLPGDCVKALEQAGLKFNDCDDTDPNVHPGAPELIDGKDNDCDGELWGLDLYGDLANIYGECWDGEECDDSNMNTSDDTCVRGVCVGKDSTDPPP